MRKDAYSLGRSEERNLIQDELIAEQRELIAQQKQEIADLKERFLEKNRSLQAWANGSGLTRATPASTREQGAGTEHQLRDATTSTWDLYQVEVDSSSLRNSGTPDLTRRENQLDRQNRQNQQERRTDNEHSEQRQVNSRGNGSGGPRNNNLPPEDEVDKTSRPINRASTSRTPDDEALNRLNQNNRNNENNQNQRQRLGKTEQRLEGQRTERNRHLQRGNDDNRLDNQRAPSGTGNYEEFKHFLNSQGIDVGPLDPDPFQPTNVRGMEEGKPWNPARGVNPVRWIHPSGVKDYVGRRSAKAGTPFVPTMRGSLLPPVQSSPGRVRELIQELGAARFVPSEIAGKEGTVGLKKSAPATLPAKSPLQEGMEAFFQKRDLALLELAQSRPSVQTQPASAVLGERRTFQSFLDTLPSSPVPARGVLNRSDSLASIASNESDESDASETGSELGKRIFSASRQSRATLPPRVGHGPLNAPAAGLTPLALLARSIPSAPIVETAVRTHAASPASPGSANGQRQDVLRQNIVDDARTPRGEKERSVSFSVPRDPPESIDPYAVHERLRDEEPLQNEVTPGQQYKSFNEEWDALSSSSTSSASSVAGDGPEELVDFGDFEPEDNMVVQRSYSAVSMDSGRDSPPVLSADESGESKTPLRVADRAAVNPKGNDLADQHAQLIKELSERLKRVKETEE